MFLSALTVPLLLACGGTSIGPTCGGGTTLTAGECVVGQNTGGNGGFGVPADTSPFLSIDGGNKVSFPQVPSNAASHAFFWRGGLRNWFYGSAGDAQVGPQRDAGLESLSPPRGKGIPLISALTWASPSGRDSRARAVD